MNIIEKEKKEQKFNENIHEKLTCLPCQLNKISQNVNLQK